MAEGIASLPPSGRRWARRTAVALLGLLLSALCLPRARAASPADELLRLVPEDVGFCLVVEDLRGHSADLLGSPFAQAFRKSPLGTALARDPELAKLARVEEHLRTYLQVDWARLRDD